MSVEWLKDSVKLIASVCAVIALIECAADSEDWDGGLRLLGGAAVALSIVRLISGFL